MPIDPSIALGVKPMQFESPINQMAKMYELQNAQQANQVNQLAMQEKQREIAENEAVKNYFARNDRTSPDFAKNLYGISPEAGQKYEKFISETAKEKAATRTSELDALTKAHGIVKTSLSSIIGNPTLANAISTLRRTGKMLGEDMSDDEAEIMALGENPAAIRNWAASHSLEADKLLPKTERVDVGGAINYTNINPVTGLPTVVGTTAKTATPGEQKPTFNQGAWYYPPTAENPQGIKVGQPQGEIPKLKPGETWDATTQTVKQVPGSAEYIKQSNLHGTDYNAAKTVVSKMNNAIKKVDEILKPENASGFENNFGGYNAAVSRMFTGNTATVRKNIDSLKADMKSAGLELVRAGGSIGALTEREWPMLESQIDAIDYTLDEDAAKAAFDRVKSTFNRIKEQAKDTYQTTWGETQYYNPNVFKSTDTTPVNPNANDKAAYEAYLKAHSGKNTSGKRQEKP